MEDAVVAKVSRLTLCRLYKPEEEYDRTCPPKLSWHAPHAAQARRTEGLLLAAGLAAVVAWMAAGLK